MRRFGWCTLLFCCFQLSGQETAEKKVIIGESARIKLEKAVRDSGAAVGDSVFIRLSSWKINWNSGSKKIRFIICSAPIRFATGRAITAPNENRAICRCRKVFIKSCDLIQIAATIYRWVSITRMHRTGIFQTPNDPEAPFTSTEVADRRVAFRSAMSILKKYTGWRGKPHSKGNNTFRFIFSPSG